MANRYSKTGFTKREIKTLDSMRLDLFRIVRNRANKQDSPKALDALESAQRFIKYAIMESEDWKKSV